MNMTNMYKNIFKYACEMVCPYNINIRLAVLLS